MLPARILFRATTLIIQFILIIALPHLSLAQDWGFRVTPRGTIRAVEVSTPAISAMFNYAEGLLMLDKDYAWEPCLAKDYRWLDERRIEFKLREGVRFHNGEKFDAKAVKVNWEHYRLMENPRVNRFNVLPDETVLQIIDEYKVRFTLPKPDGLAFSKFSYFFQFAPKFYAQHKFVENNYGYLPEAGPWGTGPFRLTEGKLRYGRPSEWLVLDAYEDYWDPRYPKLQKVVFDNTLVTTREEAMRLCREKVGAVDIVTIIRPLDTLKVAESAFAKVVKSKDVSVVNGWFNQRKKGSKWTDIRLRKAVNYSINRKELLKYAARGNAYNLGGHIPPGAFGHTPNLNLYSYDTDKARSLIAEAGYPDGFEVKIITAEGWKLEAQIIKGMLERIGLKVKLEVLKQKEWFMKTYIPYLDRPPEDQDWDISILFWSNWFGHTAATFLTFSLLEESDFRWIKYDATFEDLFKKMARTMDKNVQEKKIREMVKYVYDQAYFLFIYSPFTLYAVNKDVNFVPQKSLWLRLKETSVTENHWSVRGKNN